MSVFPKAVLACQKAKIVLTRLPVRAGSESGRQQVAPSRYLPSLPWRARWQRLMRENSSDPNGTAVWRAWVYGGGRRVAFVARRTRSRDVRDRAAARSDESGCTMQVRTATLAGVARVSTPS